MENEKQEIIKNTEQPKREERLQKALITECQTNNKILKNIVYGLIGLVAILICINLFFNETKKYFLVDKSGQVNQLTEEEMQMTDQTIYQFVDNAVVNTFSLSYINLDEHFNYINHFYSTYGLDNIKAAFKRNNWFQYIKENNITIHIAPIGKVLKIQPMSGAVTVYRSYAVEEITKTGRRFSETVYKVVVTRDDSSSRYFYRLKIESVKEMTLQDYNQQFNMMIEPK